MHTLPKIDLHCHLDGSLSPELISECLGRNVRVEDLTAPYNCQSLAEYLTKFDLPVSCLQTSEHITAAVTDLIRQAKEDNVSYIEIRFAPTLSLNDNLSYHEIYEAAVRGCTEGLKLYGVYSNIIACAMRNHSEEQNLNMLKSGLDYLGNGLCAMDLAGDEAGYPNSLFTYLFDAMNKYDIPYTDQGYFSYGKM